MSFLVGSVLFPILTRYIILSKFTFQGFPNQVFFLCVYLLVFPDAFAYYLSVMHQLWCNVRMEIHIAHRAYRLQYIYIYRKKKRNNSWRTKKPKKKKHITQEVKNFFFLFFSENERISKKIKDQHTRWIVVLAQLLHVGLNIFPSCRIPQKCGPRNFYI